MMVAVTIKEGPRGGDDDGGASGDEGDGENRNYNNKGTIYGVSTAALHYSEHFICGNLFNNFNLMR